MTAKKVAPELEDFADHIGQFMEYWGFKKVHGQIWTHLYLSKESLDAGELMQRLGISKALVSISLKELLDYGVIEETPKSPRGTRTYRALSDISQPIIQTIRRREQRMMARILSSYHQLVRLSEASQNDLDIEAGKLSKLGELIALADGLIAEFVKGRWLALANLLSWTKRQQPLPPVDKTKDF